MSSRLAILLIWSSSYLLNGRWLTLTSPFLFLSFCFADKGEEIGGYNCLMYAAHYINNHRLSLIFTPLLRIYWCIYIQNFQSDFSHFVVYSGDVIFRTLVKYKNPSSNKLFLFIKSNFAPNTSWVLCLDILGSLLASLATNF